MQTLSKNWNTDENYWQINPIMKTISQFNKLYTSDKSKNKQKSSKIMWAIALFLDPNDSNVWRNVLKEDKIKLIESEYMKGEDFKFSDKQIVELCEVYLDRCITIAEKELVNLEEKLQERGRFIKETPYSLDSYEETEDGKFKRSKGTAEQLDKMVVGTYNIHKQYNQIKKDIQEESNSGRTKGGQNESASEKGVL